MASRERVRLMEIGGPASRTDPSRDRRSRRQEDEPSEGCKSLWLLLALPVLAGLMVGAGTVGQPGVQPGQMASVPLVESPAGETVAGTPSFSPGGDESLVNREEESQGEAIGSGDGRIHIIPALSAHSVKNGDRMTIQAVVRSERPVVRVGARIQRDGGVPGHHVADVVLRPAPANLGAANEAGTVGLWQVEWTAAGLEEAFYTVTITVEDDQGHEWADRSLRFSDPIAGRDQVGTTDYPDGGMRRIDGVACPFGEDVARTAVIDVAAGYAYFGTWTSPGRVVKVALGVGAAPPTRAGAVTLEDGEEFLVSAVIDPAGGYAYFGTNTYPGRVVKVALGAGAVPPQRVGAVTLESDEGFLQSAVIDVAGGYAYFGTYTGPGRVVKVALGVGAAPPQRVGAVTLHAGENYLRSAVIDPAAGYAWFGTWTSPGQVVKVALGVGPAPPVRVGSVTLNSGENALMSAVIDLDAGYAYFGTFTSPGRVVKVALGAGVNPPERVGAVVFASGEDNLLSAVIDPANGYAWFGTWTSPSRVVKVALGAGPALPSRLGALSLESEEDRLHSAVIDTAGGYAFFGTQTYPGRVVKVALGVGAGLPTRVGAVTFQDGQNEFHSAVIDRVNGYAYFGTDANPGRVVKVALGVGSAPPERVGSVTLESGENMLRSAVIDPVAGYAYFGTLTIPGRVVKVALGAGAAPPVRVGSVILNSGEDGLVSAVIDPAGGNAWFGTATTPGRVVKVALGAGAAPPERVGAVTLESGENSLRSAVIDPAAGYAWFGTVTTPGRVVKVALGGGLDSPARVGAITLQSGESLLSSAVIDVAAGYAYFGSATTPGRVIKVALGAAAAPPERVGAVILESGENQLWSAVIDPAGEYAWFGTDTNPGRVVKVVLGAGAAPPERVGVVTLDPEERYLRSAIVDPDIGYAWFGAKTFPARVVRLGLSQKGFLKGTRLNLPEAGRVTHVRMYSHAAAGNYRLGLYDNSSPPALVWQSPALGNNLAEGWLSVTTGAGTPQTLDLPPGTYWLAWQVNTATPVPSWAPGSMGDGFFVPRSWGAFPGSLDPAAHAAHTLTDEIWSAYLIYETPKTLTVSRTGAGTGTVTSNPAGINCGAVCAANFPHGVSVTLTAEAAPGSVFAGWSGAGCSGTGACVVSMTRAHTVTAAFDVQAYNLTVVKSGRGMGTVTSVPAGINCGKSCSAGYPPGTVVTLTAEAAPGSVFAGWSGSGCSGTGNCVVSMTRDRVVTAAFDIAPGAMEPMGLAVDELPGGGATGNLNGILEPGETVAVAPSWRNPGPGGVTVTGLATELTGPGSGYALVDATANYGTIPAGVTVNCGDATGNCYLVSLAVPAVRPVLHWDLTFTETLSTGEVKTWTIHVGDSFVDVGVGHWAYRFIETLLHSGITAGCGGFDYCPTATLTRWQMGVFLAKAMVGDEALLPDSGTVPGLGSYTCGAGGVSVFGDIPPTDPACRHIHYIAAEEVTAGCGGGNYCPAQQVTRWQMGVFLAKAMVGDEALLPDSGTVPGLGDYTCGAGGTSVFGDVPPTDPACRHIHYIAAEGVTAGCGGGNYCPTHNLSRDQMAVFLVKAFGLTLE